MSAKPYRAKPGDFEVRILPDGRCEFSGPVDVKLLRFSDDKRVY